MDIDHSKKQDVTLRLFVSKFKGDVNDEFIKKEFNPKSFRFSKNKHSCIVQYDNEDAYNIALSKKSTLFEVSVFQPRTLGIELFVGGIPFNQSLKHVYQAIPHKDVIGQVRLKKGKKFAFAFVKVKRGSELSIVNSSVSTKVKNVSASLSIKPSVQRGFKLFFRGLNKNSTGNSIKQLLDASEIKCSEMQFFKKNEKNMGCGFISLPNAHDLEKVVSLKLSPESKLKFEKFNSMKRSYASVVRAAPKNSKNAKNSKKIPSKLSKGKSNLDSMKPPKSVSSKVSTKISSLTEMVKSLTKKVETLEKHVSMLESEIHEFGSRLSSSFKRMRSPTTRTVSPPQKRFLTGKIISRPNLYTSPDKPMSTGSVNDSFNFGTGNPFVPPQNTSHEPQNPNLEKSTPIQNSTPTSLTDLNSTLSQTNNQ